MIEQYYPTTEDLIRDQRTKLRLLTALLLLTVIAVFGVVGFLFMRGARTTDTEPWLIGAAMFICIAIPVAIWNNPRYGAYILAAAAFLFGGDPSAPIPTIPTTRVPFWWNISIIGQRAGTASLNGIAISPAEVVIIVTLLAWLVRGVARRDLRPRIGPVGPWVFGYIAAVSAGFVLGIVRGGSVNAALWEVRTQFHFLAAFIIGANVLREPKDVKPLLWLLIACTGLQGIFGTITYFSVGETVSENGIMSHDDSMLFNLVFFVFFLAAMTGTNRKLTWWSLVAVPGAVISVMANQRRAGIAAFIVAFLPLLPILWVIWQERRKQVATFGMIFLAAAAVYLPVAWRAQGAWALPARSLRSMSSPDGRDAASNVYRMTEDANLKFTRDLSPWLGKGYGRPFAKPLPLPEIKFPMKDYFPHNSLLWVWMNVGNIGFFFFLMMFAAVCIAGIHQLKETSDPWLRIVGILGIMDMLMLFAYGKFDLQFVNPRQMILAAIFVGALSVLPQLQPKPEQEVIPA